MMCTVRCDVNCLWRHAMMPQLAPKPAAPKPVAPKPVVEPKAVGEPKPVVEPKPVGEGAAAMTKATRALEVVIQHFPINIAVNRHLNGIARATRNNVQTQARMWALLCPEV